MFICLYWTFYGNILRGLWGQPSSITKSGGNGEKDVGLKERWRSPQEAASGGKECEKWMNGWSGAVLALIELGSVVYILQR